MPNQAVLWALENSFIFCYSLSISQIRFISNHYFYISRLNSNILLSLKRTFKIWFLIIKCSIMAIALMSHMKLEVILAKDHVRISRYVNNEKSLSVTKKDKFWNLSYFPFEFVVLRTEIQNSSGIDINGKIYISTRTVIIRRGVKFHQSLRIYATNRRISTNLWHRSDITDWSKMTNKFSWICDVAAK